MVYIKMLLLLVIIVVAFTVGMWSEQCGLGKINKRLLVAGAILGSLSYLTIIL